jgi:hypothetical protein
MLSSFWVHHIARAALFSFVVAHFFHKPDNGRYRILVCTCTRCAQAWQRGNLTQGVSRRGLLHDTAAHHYPTTQNSTDHHKDITSGLNLTATQPNRALSWIRLVGGGSASHGRVPSGAHADRTNNDQQPTCPTLVMVGVDATPNPGLRNPTNFLGKGIGHGNVTACLDCLLMARRVLERGGSASYIAAMQDEAQTLTVVCSVVAGVGAFH